MVLVLYSTTLFESPGSILGPLSRSKFWAPPMTSDSSDPRLQNNKNNPTWSAAYKASVGSLSSSNSLLHTGKPKATCRNTVLSQWHNHMIVAPFPETAICGTVPTNECGSGPVSVLGKQIQECNAKLVPPSHSTTGISSEGPCPEPVED